MKKILVTGASGFLGHHVLKLLSDDGFEIHAISSREGGFRKAEVDWHKCDIHDKASVVMLCKKIKANLLLHLAWVTTPDNYWESEENFKWVVSSLVLAEEFIKNGGERIVSAGSCASSRIGRTNLVFVVLFSDQYGAGVFTLNEIPKVVVVQFFFLRRSS